MTADDNITNQKTVATPVTITLHDLMVRAEAIRAQYEKVNALNGKDAWRIRDYAMGFGGDFGDLMKLVMAKENLRDIVDVDNKLAHELADCLWSILVLANHYGIDLEKEFMITMNKISDRIKNVDVV